MAATDDARRATVDTQGPATRGPADGTQTSPSQPIGPRQLESPVDLRQLEDRARTAAARAMAEEDAVPPGAVGENRTLELLTLLVAAWLAVSPMVLVFPMTVAGRDARLWTSGLALLLMIAAVARLRVPRATPRAASTLIVASALTVAVPFFVLGQHPRGDLTTPWWDLAGTGTVLLILSAIGLARVWGSGGRSVRTRV